MQPLKRNGWIEVICGSMFSGKSEELIRRIKRARIARQTVQVFKPRLDNRYAPDAVVSHNGALEQAESVARAEELLDRVWPHADVVAVDEVQFFDDAIVDVAEMLAGRGVRVILAGLDLDFRGEPFGPTPLLMARAEYVTKLHAICVRCGQPATRTQRLVNGRPAHYNDPVILVGAAERYEARCRHCHEVPGKPAAAGLAHPAVPQADG